MPHCESSELFAPVESSILLPFTLLVTEFDLIEATALSPYVSASSRESVCYGQAQIVPPVDGWLHSRELLRAW